MTKNCSALALVERVCPRDAETDSAELELAAAALERMKSRRNEDPREWARRLSWWMASFKD